MFTNIVLNSDSYKFSHFQQYPPGATRVSSYVESRGGEFDGTLFFGLQIFLQDYLSRPFAQEDIDEAEEFAGAHGVPFNKAGWQYILDVHDGYLPIEIKAVPEGTYVPVSNVLAQVINTDPKVPWLTGYVETMLLRAIWYPTTVATISYKIRQTVMAALAETSDGVPEEQIGFKLNDFGARGVSSCESATIGGMAHLVSFQGTDNVTAVLGARRYYDEPMAGFSIPAAEHSTITAWGRDGEVAAYRNMLDQFAGKFPLVAVVSDSYDIYNAVTEIWGGVLKDRVETCGSTVVVRPDSGDPVEVVSEVIQGLMNRFGKTTNSKGYDVLPDCIRVIQGDGINVHSIPKILARMKENKLSADNITFGMGGGLLQQLDRDTCRFAMKASAIEINGTWRDVYKDPVTDTGKISKKGVQALIKRGGTYETVRRDQLNDEPDVLEPVYRDGRILKRESFAEIRARAAVHG